MQQDFDIMKLSDIRQTFFDFFQSKGHQIVPSAPMVVKNDPTLMFTNAGMNQFKDYFLGNTTPKHRRVANSQKCLRVSGKHNDLEEVGVDTYHHTMFEMLGNWSFGDYFKEEAIAWAWELLTEVYQIPKDKLYVTVFEGDEKDGLEKDMESYNIWKKYINEDRIIFASKKDNFWEMGDIGPCGPCTEIHVDNRSDEERKKTDGKELVNQDHPEVIEIWNNVFIQYNRKSDRSLEPLPEKHVDTGMGLERLAMTLQGKRSNYDIDLFQTLIEHISKVANVTYGKDENIDIALRVIADHIRAIAFSIADGQLPANTGAGYVIRRILRRAIRYGYQTLKLDEPFLADLSKLLVKLMKNPFKELESQKGLIYKVILEEENAFLKTLGKGILRFENYLNTKESNDYIDIENKIIRGKLAFELFDTYGFPLDLTELMAREKGFKVDIEGFKTLMKEQKDRSRAATNIEAGDWIQINDGESEFIGYDTLTADVQILRYRSIKQKKKSFFQVVFDKTPFYPEGGGQVGDSGYIEKNGKKYEVFDTKKENNLIIHLMNKIPEELEGIFKAAVNKDKRIRCMLNHTATHLLHYALRKVLGNHVEQKGSLVSPDYLRFDFSHFSKIEEEQLEEIGFIVRDYIRKDIPLNEHRSIPIEKATEMGAMALFGEKYGDHVRVIQFGESIELCGGTHVSSTGKIGHFIILSESAIAAGVRRIEAITGEKAERYLLDKLKQFNEISKLLKNPKNPVKAIADLLEKNNQLNKEVERLNKIQAKSIKQELKSKIIQENGISLLTAIVELDNASIKDILFQLRGEFENFVGIIGGNNKDKCSLNIIASDHIVKEKDFNAGEIIREAAKHIHGGGGGQPFFATAGGKNAQGLPDAIDFVKKKL